MAETVNKFDMSKLNDEQMSFYHTQLATLSKSLKAINESSDIEETRTDLAAISESMYALVKAFQPNRTDLYFQFCPMAKNGDGANWLSETKEVVNPYMGQRMLTCGTTKEVLAFVK
jgi:Cu(I)/Ag(I) efflux system membrane fusion protein